jgi:hypothetical protein
LIRWKRQQQLGLFKKLLGYRVNHPRLNSQPRIANEIEIGVQPKFLASYVLKQRVSDLPREATSHFERRLRGSENYLNEDRGIAAPILTHTIVNSRNVRISEENPSEPFHPLANLLQRNHF